MLFMEHRVRAATGRMSGIQTNLFFWALTPLHPQYAGLFLGLVAKWGPSSQESHPGTNNIQRKEYQWLQWLFFRNEETVPRSSWQNSSSWLIGQNGMMQLRQTIDCRETEAALTGLDLPQSTSGLEIASLSLVFLNVLSKEEDLARREIVTGLAPNHVHHPALGWMREDPLGCSHSGPDEIKVPEYSSRYLENWKNQMYIWEVESIGFFNESDSLVQENTFFIWVQY